MDKNSQDIFDAGNDILKSVSQAIDTNDYSHLAEDITKTVKAVSYEKKVTYSSSLKQRRPAPKVYPFLQKKVSRYLGIPEIFFGGAVGILFFLPLFMGLVLIHEVIPAAIFFALFALAMVVCGKGLKKFKLAKKFYQYGNILKDSDYFAISDLAKVSLKSDSEVLKDIKDMINMGFLPRAKLDRTETTCMITDAAYQMYLGAEHDRVERELKEAREQEAARARQQETESLPTKAKGLVEEGNEYIRFVREINDVIPDTDEMSNKLYRLEEIMNRIFAQVEKEPDSADELHKLMNYYLPTTKKLLAAYVELDKQPDGENVTQTKLEIDSAMDMINEAFEHLLDSMFQDMAWDISSDISVMKTMMAQDGLTSDGGMAAAGMQMAAAQGQALEFKSE